MPKSATWPLGTELKFTQASAVRLAVCSEALSGMETYAPEPLTLADLRIAGETSTTFVYPDPPLSEGELSRLRVLDKRITVTTPLLLLATRAHSAVPGDATTTESAGPAPQL